MGLVTNAELIGEDIGGGWIHIELGIFIIVDKETDD